MIAEVIPGAYDTEGKKVLRPFDRRRGLRPTYPLGRYVSQPLMVHCKSVEEICTFLKTCKYVSDRELFGKDDYWQPPEDFEKRKKGDCEDFAFWTWRQLMELGYNCRVVFGRHGRYGTGHAWVQFVQDGQCYIVEPLLRLLGSRFARLSTLRYQPRFSVAWDGEKLSYYAHHNKPLPPLSSLLPLLPEYLIIRGKVWIIVLVKFPWILMNLSKRLMKNIRWTRTKVEDH